eukprot:5893506-Prymnesium_polylepis.1
MAQGPQGAPASAPLAATQEGGETSRRSRRRTTRMPHRRWKPCRPRGLLPEPSCLGVLTGIPRTNPSPRRTSRLELFWLPTFYVETLRKGQQHGTCKAVQNLNIRPPLGLLP